MDDKNTYYFTVGELIKILQQYPEGMPVLVSAVLNTKITSPTHPT